MGCHSPISVLMRGTTCYLICAAQQDYTTVQQVVQFGVSNTEQTVSIPFVDNEIYEPSETFALRLSLPNSQPGVTIGQSLATVEIIDDDGT